MKKTLSLLLSLVMLFSSVIGTSMTASADDVDYTTISTNGTWYTGNITDYNTVDYYRVNLTSDGTLTFKFMQYMNYINFDVYSSDLSNRIISSCPGGGNASSPVTNTYTADLSKGTYYVKISKYSDYTGKYKLSWNLKVKVSRPNDLRVTSRKTTSLKLAWNKVSGVSGYQIQRKVGSKYKHIAYTSKIYYTVKDLKSATNYALRVRAYKTIDGKKYFSSWRNLTTPTKPSKVSIKTPSTNSKHQIIVKWKALTRGSGYQVQFSKKKNFSSVIATKTVSGKTKTSYTGKKFTKGRTYYVRVRGYKTVDGTKYYGAWSNVKSIKCR